MKRDIIFVTGFFGAPIMQRAQRLAAEKDYSLLSLDKEIEKADGRTIRRLCMMMGEHEYRNREYEQLKQIIEETEGHQPEMATSRPVPAGKSGDAAGLVVACGDGVLLDDMSRELMQKHTILVVGAELSIEKLWENARREEKSYHAFMHFGSEESKRKAFIQLFERQQVLFKKLL